MLPHKRYLDARNERNERQSRWLTILAGAVTIIIILAIATGPTFFGAASDQADPSAQIESKDTE